MASTRRVTVTLSGRLLDRVERLLKQAPEGSTMASVVRTLAWCGVQWIDEQRERRSVHAAIRRLLDGDGEL